MMENYDKEFWENKKCPKYDCKKESCKCGLKKVYIPTTLGDDSKDSSVAPKNGAYCNAIVVYEANDHVYVYSTEGIPTLINVEGGSSEEAIEELTKKLNKEILDRGAADDVLQQEINDLKNSPDVVDIVATYAALQAYDTSHLGDNDIIRVLQDEQHDGQSTYYRWDKHNSAWVYIGAVGDYYTKGQVDTLLADKQNKLTAGANVAITQVDDDLVISATDTTYSAFVGTDGVDPGTAGLVPAPATTDADKFLKSDGTWDTVSAGPTVVQTTGTSTTDVMSQNATTDMIYTPKQTATYNNWGAVYIGNKDSSNNVIVDPSTSDVHETYFYALPSDNVVPKSRGVNILGSIADGQGNISIGKSSYTNKNGGVALGHGARGTGAGSIGIGESADTDGKNHSIALGDFAKTTRNGEMNIGTGSYNSGYNNTKYRVLGGVHDGQNNHDAATVAQGNTLSTSAPTTSTEGVLGQLWTDTTNMHTYQCTAISGSTYTWTQRW